MREINVQQNLQISQWNPQQQESQSLQQKESEIPEVHTDEENGTQMKNVTVGEFDEDNDEDDTASMRMFKVNVLSPKFKEELKTT